MFNENALKSKLVLNGMNTDAAAKAIGITRVTFCRRLSGKRQFTCDEMYKLIKLLKLTNEEVGTIFFADEVS